jgi:uncharacterized protein (TIGR03067 family)
MKLRCLVLLAVALMLGADKKDPAKEDLKKLQGKWQTTKLVYNGKDIDTAGKGKIDLVFKGATASVEAGKDVKKEYAKIKVTLDPSVKPASLDVEILLGTQKGAKMEGIYKVEKDKLTLCVKVLGMDRPTKFESPEGQSVALLELEKVKE